MFDHVTLTVRNLSAATGFYEKALAPLGLKLLVSAKDEYCGFGDSRPFFWIAPAEPNHPASGPTHVAFAATQREQVDAFYHLATTAGGKDNGRPEYHTEYAPNYYAAFVFDLDGNNIEAVFRDPSVG